MQTNLNLWVIVNCCFLDQLSLSNSDLHEHTYIYSGTWLRGRLSSHRQLHSSIYSQFHCGSMPDPRGCISWRQKVHLTDMSPHQILRSETKINSLLIEYHWEIWFDNKLHRACYLFYCASSPYHRDYWRYELSRLVTNPTMWVCAQQRLRSAWAHTHFVGFVTRRLKCSSLHPVIKYGRRMTDWFICRY